MGTPAINLFEAVIDGKKIIAVPEKFEFPLQPICRSRLGELAGPRTKVRIGARPEHVRLVSSGGVEGTVYGVEKSWRRNGRDDQRRGSFLSRHDAAYESAGAQSARAYRIYG